MNQNDRPKKYANPADPEYRVWLLQQKRKKRKGVAEEPVNE